MSALLLIAVYSSSCLFLLWLTHRFLLPFSPRLGAALVLLPLIFTGRALLTGGYFGPLNLAYHSVPLAAQAARLPEASHRSAALSDITVQMVPWREAVRESMSRARLPLLNRFMLSGDVLLAAMAPAALHPNVLIGLLLPLPTAWTFACAFTLFVAGLCTFHYMRSLAVGETAALFAAVAWTLSGAMTFSVGWPQAQVLAVFPLLLLGLRRLASGIRGGMATMTTALALMVIGGHPETLLLTVAGAGVIFLFEVAASQRRGRAISRAALAGVLAAAISAAALFPFLEALPQTAENRDRHAYYAKHKKSVPVGESLRAALALAYPLAFDSVTGETPRKPITFVLVIRSSLGGLALALAAVGLASRRRERWGLFATGALSAMVASGVPGVTDVVTKLPLFDIAIYEYFLGITAFCVVALAGLGLQELEDRGRRVHLVLLLLVSLALLFIGLWWRSQLVGEGYATRGHDLSIAFLLEPILLFIAGALVWHPDRRLLGTFAVVLLLLSRAAEIPRVYQAFPIRFFYPQVEELRRLPSGEGPYRVVGLGNSMVPNQSALWGLEDPRGYQAMTNLRYRETYPLWSVHQPVWFNRVDDLTRPFLSFLNVRFAIAGPQEPLPRGWREFIRGENCAVFENPGALPRAFAPERIRFVSPGGGTVEEMKNCTDFSKVAWIEDSHQAPRGVPNGRAEVTTTREGADLLLHIRADAASWVVVSQTAWMGWKAFLEGDRIPLYFANHASLGFQVPSGEHRVHLIYRPDSFRIGVTVTALSLVLFGILLYRRVG